jgi:hypothetical protein
MNTPGYRGHMARAHIRTISTTLLISLRRAANGHICTLDSGGVLALRT